MENINDQLQAAKAQLAYQKMMFEAGRCGKVVLEKALNEVVELEKVHFASLKTEATNSGAKISGVFVDETFGFAQVPDDGTLPPRGGTVTEYSEDSYKEDSSENKEDSRFDFAQLPADKKDPYLTAKSDLAVEIRRLTELEAEKSNALAMAPIDSPQPYLCGELVAGRKKIEELWDQLYELERTGQLPAPPVPTRPLSGDELVDKELKLARIAKDLDSMRNIRQKASKALRDAAGNTIDKQKFQLNVEKYTAKIAWCDAEIDRLEKERNILLGRG